MKHNPFWNRDGGRCGWGVSLRIGAGLTSKVGPIAEFAVISGSGGEPPLLRPLKRNRELFQNSDRVFKWDGMMLLSDMHMAFCLATPLAIRNAFF